MAVDATLTGYIRRLHVLHDFGGRRAGISVGTGETGLNGAKRQGFVAE